MPSICSQYLCNKEAKYIEDYSLYTPHDIIMGYGPKRFCHRHKTDTMFPISRRCKNDGCKTIANYNFPGEKKAIYCAKHKHEDMVSLRRSNVCMYPKCNIRATFGTNANKSMFCAKHKSFYRKMNQKKCNVDGCNTVPSFNFITKKIPLFCKKHKQENMINVYRHYRNTHSDSCKYSGCEIVAHYNFVSDKVPRFCVKHKQPSMVYIRTKGTKCHYKGCMKTPQFSLDGTMRKWCHEHATKQMKRQLYKTCTVSGCKMSANFNYIGLQPSKCEHHKNNSMVNIARTSLCKENGCMRRPSYNFENSYYSLYCQYHKLHNMVVTNIDHVECFDKDCSKRVTYSLFDKQKKIFEFFCSKHRNAYCNRITDQLCENASCNSYASWGIIHTRPRFCVKHKVIGMIRNPNKWCIVCLRENNRKKTPATHGKHFLLKRCDKHKEKDDDEICVDTCISCGLHFILDRDKKCEHCNPESFKRYRLQKQNELMDYLDSVGLKGVSTDTIIDDGICGKERPDRIFDLKYCILIVECDEEQHSDRVKECEYQRMVNISQSFGGTPVCFIRWNPDHYSFSSSISSSTESIHSRYKTLSNFIQDTYAMILDECIYEKSDKNPLYGINRFNTNALLQVIYLYYDDWCNMESVKWKPLLIKHITS